MNGFDFCQCEQQQQQQKHLCTFSSCSYTPLCLMLFYDLILLQDLYYTSSLRSIPLISSQTQGIAVTILYEIQKIHVDFTSVLQSQCKTVAKSQKTFHQDVALPPESSSGSLICLQPLSVLPLVHSSSSFKSTVLSQRII